MINKIHKKALAVLDSRWLLVTIIAFFMSQALWIAFSLSYPTIYDETFHFTTIQLFSHQLSPFTNHPDRLIYGLRDFVYGGSDFYHYLMSFPYRIIAQFVSSLTHQVIILRIINILLVVAGLWVYSRTFRLVGIKQRFINIALFIFVLLPMVPLVSASINYDNMLFPLTATFLWVGITIIKTVKMNWIKYIILIVVGCLASLIKFTFLPIFAVGIIYILVVELRKYGKRIGRKFKNSFKRTSTTIIVPVLLILLTTVILFSLVYIKNFVSFGTPISVCTDVALRQSCAKYPVLQRNYTLEDTKATRIPQTLGDFTIDWVHRMTDFGITAGFSNNNFVVAPSPPLLSDTIIFGIIIGIGVLLYAWRDLYNSNTEIYFIATMSVACIVSVLAYNAIDYYKVNTAVANQPRYLLSLMPVVIVLSVSAYDFILHRASYLKWATLITILVLFTQGGGAVTTILRSDDTWYWQNTRVIQANHLAKRILSPLVKER